MEKKILPLLHVTVFTFGEQKELEQIAELTLCGYLSLRTMKAAIRLNGFLLGGVHLKFHTEKMFA